MNEDNKARKYTLKKIPRRYRKKHGPRFSFIKMREKLEAEVNR